jgi:hypothetical protein
MNKFRPLFSGLIILLGLVTKFPCPLNAEITSVYPQDEWCQLQAKSSEFKMDEFELQKWDKITADLIHDNPAIEANSYRVYAYLYEAQKQAAFLSFSAKGAYEGSLEPVSSAVLALFFPNQSQVSSDEYSNLLAQMVMSKIRPRFEEETANLQDFPIAKTDSRLRQFPQPCYGLEVASWKPWILPDPLQFMVSKPPSATSDPYWMPQAEFVKRVVESATKQQKQICKWWAGEKTQGSGDWIVILNDYLFSHVVDFPKIVFVRAVHAESLVDGNIAIFNSKYTYLIRRPMMVDSSIKPIVNVPRHPSYPSGHSTLSTISAIILTYYFPDNRDDWFYKAHEAGLSRIWAGLHFPLDDQAGQFLGKQIGDAIVSKFACLELEEKKYLSDSENKGDNF